MTAKENIARMPDFCYSVLPSDLSIIIIKAGEEGYYPAPELKIRDGRVMPFPQREALVNQRVDALNAIEGVDRATRMAMEFGSMWGWEKESATIEFWREELALRGI